MDMKISLKSGLWRAAPSSLEQKSPCPLFQRGRDAGILLPPPLAKGVGGIFKRLPWEANRISTQAAQYGKNLGPYQLQIGFRASGFLGGMKAKP
jgi:hypothetical protein